MTGLTTLLQFALALLIAAQQPNVPTTLREEAIRTANFALHYAMSFDELEPPTGGTVVAPEEVLVLPPPTPLVECTLKVSTTTHPSGVILGLFEWTATGPAHIGHITTSSGFAHDLKPVSGGTIKSNLMDDGSLKGEATFALTTGDIVARCNASL